MHLLFFSFIHFQRQFHFGNVSGLKHPFSCVIAGPSQSGKTVFLRKLLKGAHLFIDEAPERIVWGYGAQNDEQLNLIKKV